jgi:uncharacterized membrane protein YdjX (TVP38/TMEM64 family)
LGKTDPPSERPIIQPLTEKDRKGLIVGLLLLAVLVIVTIWLALSGHLAEITKRLVLMLGSKEHMRAYLESWGAWAPVAFMVLQGLQVVIAPIPGELTGVVGGFLFGTWRAVVYSTIGLTVGSALAFMLARLIGLPFVKLFVRPDQFEKLEFLLKPRGEIALLLLFIIPGFPKDVLSYLLGLTPLTFLKLIVICGLGRLPGTILLGLSGAALYKEDWDLVITLIVICVLVVIVFYFKGEQISGWIKEKIQGEGKNGG